jgi:hypothetical protein
MNANTRFLAVAYKWLLVPPELNDFDVTLVLSHCRGRLTAPDALTMDEAAARVYHAKLPPKETKREQSDVSGTLGLLFPVSDEQARLKASAFERLVADTIVWQLAEEDLSNDKTWILLLGPMLPKLRGRFMYRGVSEHVSVCAVTYQPEWFRRLEAAEQSFQRLKSADRFGLGSIYPPRALDRGSRSWVYRSSESVPLHFEVVSNVWDSSYPARDWLPQIKGDIERLVSPQFVDGDSSALVRLPILLSKAVAKAESTQRCEDLFVKFLLAFRGAKGAKDDLSKLIASPEFRTVVKCLFGTDSLEKADSELAKCKDDEGEEMLYTQFKDAWPDIESALRDTEAVALRERTKVLRSTRAKKLGLRDELWQHVENVVIPGDRKEVIDYLAKLAEDTERRGTARLEEIRKIFVDHAFTMPPDGVEVFNRCRGKIIISKIAKLTGVAP